LVIGSRPYEGEPQKPEAVQHLLILGHPDPGSFNHAVSARYVEVAKSNYQTVEVRDLYRMGFDPLLKDIERPHRHPGACGPDVQHEIDLIDRSDVITFVYPLWFGTPPAIIKGYIDRVFGAAFLLPDLKRERQYGSFAGKLLSIFTSSASTGPWLDEQGMTSSLQQAFGRYLAAIFGFSSTHFYHAASVVDDMSNALAEQLLFEAGEMTRLICAEAAAARHHLENG
jgi:NAD(P)H dehydrogenase (quinone)